MNKLKNTVRMALTLDNERFIPLRMEIAAIIGLNEAIIIQQIHYWNCKNEANNNNYVEGHYWTYNTMKQWCETFICFSLSTIERIFSKLEKNGLIISKQLHADKTNRTKWYRIDYEKLNYVLNGDDNQGNESLKNEGMSIIGKNQTLDKEPINNDADNQGNGICQNNEVHFLKMSECINTKTNYTKNKKRDARAREELFLDNWEPKDKDLLKSKYSLTDDDITTAIIEFKLDSNAKGRLWHNMDAAFELWCSRYKACKKRYQKASKPQETICNTTGCDTFSDYVCKVLGSVLDTQICENIKIAYLRAHKLLCIDSKNELIKNKLHDYQDKIMNLLSSAKDKQSSYYNEYYAMELHIMQSVSIDDVIERL